MGNLIGKRWIDVLSTIGRACWLTLPTPSSSGPFPTAVSTTSAQPSPSLGLPSDSIYPDPLVSSSSVRTRYKLFVQGCSGGTSATPSARHSDISLAANREASTDRSFTRASRKSSSSKGGNLAGTGDDVSASRLSRGDFPLDRKGESAWSYRVRRSSRVSWHVHGSPSSSVASPRWLDRPLQRNGWRTDNVLRARRDGDSGE